MISRAIWFGIFQRLQIALALRARVILMSLKNLLHSKPCYYPHLSTATTIEVKL